MQLRPEIQRAVELWAQGQSREAVALAEQLARRGDAEGLLLLGDFHWHGGGEVAQNLSLARRLFAEAAMAGHPIAIRASTNLLANGIGGVRDWPTALLLLADEARGDSRRAHMLRLIEAMDLTPDGEPRALPRVEQLSETPDVAIHRNAFSADECDYLIMMSEPSFEPSLVWADGKDMRDPIRTSDSAPVHWLIEDPAIHALNRRIAAMTRTRTEQGEPLLILRYEIGQQYRRHYDWLTDREHRIRTALVYLNDDYDGGETEFPRIGLKVKGRKGDALVFRNSGVDAKLDKRTEHAGLPVTRGTKYLATRWIRAQRYVPLA